LTQLYAQTGKDSTQCYTQEELQRIADRVVYANECDTLLSTCEQQLRLKDSANVALSHSNTALKTVIIVKDDMLELKEQIISGKTNEISGLRDAIKKEKRKKTWLKVGWATTSVVLTGVLTYFIIN